MITQICFGEWQTPKVGEMIYVNSISKDTDGLAKVIAVEDNWATVEFIKEEN